MNNCVFGMITDHGGLMSGESDPRGGTRRDSRISISQYWSDLKRNKGGGGWGVGCKSIAVFPEYDYFEIYS